MEKYSQHMALNLEILDKANNFSEWMYQEIKPFLRGAILEVGSGHGTYSRKILSDFKESNIILSDIDEHYVRALKKFEDSNVSALRIDISNKDDFSKITIPLDSVFALNVLEHIDNDVQAMNNIYDALRPGGRLVILVPAYMFLFNCIDENIGHYRRYEEKSIREKVSKTKFKIKKLFYFNFLSIFGWYLNGNVLKRHIINESAVGLLNLLVPILRFLEKHILRKKSGISIIVVLEK